MQLDITNTTRGSLPRVPFQEIADKTAKKIRTLSLVLCADTLSSRLNRERRKKTYAPNVLSFPISKDEGEIFINIRKAAREALSIGISVHDRVAHLFIHGILHLEGLDHSDRMDDKERDVLRSFGYRAE